MIIQFAYPLLLLAAVPLVLHAWWMGRRLHLLSRGRRVTALTLRIIIILAVVGALAGLRIGRLSKDLSVFYLLDVSDSIPKPQRDYAQAFMRKTLGEMGGPGDKAGLILFGGDAALEQGLAHKTEWEPPKSVVDRARTNIGDAIQLAMAAFSGQTQQRIVLLSDGNQNAGSAEDAARAAVAAGVAIDVLPLRYENRNDVIVEKTIVQNRVNLHEPFDVRVVATARQAGPGKLSVFQDGQLLGRYEVALEPDKKNVYTVPAQVSDAGFHHFEVQLDAEGDLIPENNKGFAFTYGAGEPRVLYVDGDGATGSTAKASEVLPSMLTAEKIGVTRVAPSGLPATLRELQNYDAVIFNNVGASELSPEQMKMIERAEHDLGLGFIMIGGEHSFGAGGYKDTPIERILPVNMDIKNEKVMPKGALVPIIHTVEIPQGQYWSEQIALAALNVLSPQDLMGVLYYSWQGGESWLFNLQPVGDKAMMRNLIQGMQPGDMPSFDKTLEMAYAALSNCGASVKHVVVISDGDPQTPNPTLVGKLQSAHITISTVCINPHSPRDGQVLQELARLGGGNYYNVTSYNTLPQIFIKEATTVRKSLIFEEPFTPVAKSFSPLLAGLGKDYPTLRGYVGTSIKSLADMPLAAQHDDPLLAHWQHGLGHTVAFTSDAKERWAADWMGWNRFGKFWSQVTRWALRTPMNPNYQLEMSFDGSKGKITIDAVDGGGQFRNFLDMKGQVVTPSFDTKDVTFRQTAPGRYEAEFEATQPGAYMLGAMAGAAGEASATGDANTTNTRSVNLAGNAAPGGGKDLITGGTTLSYSPEFQNSRSNEALLYRLADLTPGRRGRVLDEKSPVFLHNLPSFREPLALWPALLLTTLALFLADVFTRRVMIGWGEVAAGAGVAWGWTAAKLRRTRKAEEEQTSQLLEVKRKERQKTTSGAGGQREEFLATLRETAAEQQAGREPAPGAKGAPRFDRSVLDSLKERKSEVKRPAGAESPAPGDAKGAGKPPASDDDTTSALLKARSRVRERAQEKLNKPDRPAQGEDDKK